MRFGSTSAKKQVTEKKVDLKSMGQKPQFSMWKTLVAMFETCNVKYLSIAVVVMILIYQATIIIYEVIFLQW